MAVNVRLAPTPKGCVKRVSSYRLEPSGAFPDMPVSHFPFINGEIMEMRGWLEGFGADAVNGRLDVVLHEGLFSLNGELDVFHEYTRHNFMLILEMLERRAIGLAHRYPKSHFRFRVSYKTEWVAEEGGSEEPRDSEFSSGA